jgi:hypothetical protein
VKPISAQILAEIGFTIVGGLSSYYEDRFSTPAGYDRSQQAIVAFGGQKQVSLDQNNNPIYGYGDRTLIMRWDEHAQSYTWEYGPAPVVGVTPQERNGANIVFDKHGCGAMFGGMGVDRSDPNNPVFVPFNDVWRICGQSDGTYAWAQVAPTSTIADLVGRISPIAYDPTLDRYLMVGGEDAAGFNNGDAYYLTPRPAGMRWAWTEITNLPSNFGDRDRNVTFWDPRSASFVVELGYVSPTDGTTDRIAWSFAQAQWHASQIPVALDLRQGFGFDYDSARKQLVLWGDNTNPAPDQAVWLMTHTASTGPSSWRSIDLDPPLMRAWPVVVYDQAREQTIAFGGVRYDGRPVPPDVYQITLAPSWPYLAATIDLGAVRPMGIDRVHLVISGRGLGDADGTGPGTVLGDGIDVLIWDRTQQAWLSVGTATRTPSGQELITVDMTESPDRFVGDDGTVPISIRSKFPATEQLPARLDLDLLDGYLDLRPLP